MKNQKKFVSLALILIIMFSVLCINANATSSIVTWNPNDKASSVILSNGNLTTTNLNSTAVRSTEGKTSGKWYAEISCDSGSNFYIIVGKNTIPLSGDPGGLTSGAGAGYYGLTGGLYGGGGTGSNSTYGLGDVIGIAVDMDNKKVTWYKNGELLPNYNDISFVGGESTFIMFFPVGDATVTANFGNTSFQYQVPQGYSPYGEQNLPVYPTNLTATADNAQVGLTWTAFTGATSYNVKRATMAGGPYTTVGTSSTTTYTDTTVTNGTIYYYVVTAVNSGGESPNSNEVNATPISPVGGNNAILEITMVNGFVNEFDLTAAELQSFTDWYDARSSGTGKAYYTFVKNNNIKPFISRKITIAFDKILSYEVKEYND